MDPIVMILCAVPVFVGALAQRITGLGFALVAAPFLVLALGPLHGVVVANVCAACSGALSMWFTWRDAEWRRTLRLALGSILGYLPGMLVIRRVPVDWLALLVGGLCLFALLASMLIRAKPVPDGLVLSTSMGAVSGFIAVTASVGGPPLAIYGRLTGWAPKQFAASMQALTPFVLIPVLTAPSYPRFSPLGWAGLIAALLAGVLLGTRLAPKISGHTAGRLVMIIATAGATFAIARAAWGLLT